MRKKAKERHERNRKKETDRVKERIWEIRCKQENKEWREEEKKRLSH